MDEKARAKAKPLPDVALSLGCKVTRKGSVFMCCCPWHLEANPSCALYSDHAYCFSCRRAGDVIDFVQALAGVEFREAVRMINEDVKLVDGPKTEAREKTRIQASSLELAVKTYTRRFIEYGYKFTALHCYRRPDGKAHFWKMRLEHPEKGKTIRPIYREAEGAYVIGEPAGLKPLYNSDLLLKHPSPTVWFVEGEKCADILCKHRKLATTTGSATSASAFDFSSLVGRKVILWPDRDCPGMEYACRVADTLLALPVHSLYWAQPAMLGLGEGEDAVDFIEKGGDLAQVVETAEKALLCQN